MMAHRAKEINWVTCRQLERRMFNTGIIPDLRMEQQQSLCILSVFGRENDIITNHQMAVAFRTDIVFLHGYLPSYDMNGIIYNIGQAMSRHIPIYYNNLPPS
jgi:hypothetical protein